MTANLGSENPPTLFDINWSGLSILVSGDSAGLRDFLSDFLCCLRGGVMINVKLPS